MREYQNNPQYKARPAYYSRYQIKGSVLEVGCGFGYQLSYLKSRNNLVVGLDSNSLIARYAKHVVGIENMVIADAAFLPFKENMFDWVLANQVIEHLSEPLFFLKSINKVLKKGKFLFISTPNKFAYFRLFAPVLKATRLWEDDPSHLKIFSFIDIRSYLKAANFRITASEPTNLNKIPWIGKIFTAGIEIVAECCK